MRVRRVWKMILSHMAPSCLNMSSYRAIWTHFRHIFFMFYWQQDPRPFPKSPISSSSHFHDLWQIQKPRSQKVSIKEPDLSQSQWNFWPVMSQAVWKPCLKGGVPVSPVPPKYERWLVNKDLMTRDIMSSEPRHWIVFGQLVVPVLCCAETRRRSSLLSWRYWY